MQRVHSPAGHAQDITGFLQVVAVVAVVVVRMGWVGQGQVGGGVDGVGGLVSRRQSDTVFVVTQQHLSGE